jgi:hypothetical protein
MTLKLILCLPLGKVTSAPGQLTQSGDSAHDPSPQNQAPPSFARPADLCRPKAAAWEAVASQIAQSSILWELERYPDPTPPRD